MNKGIILIISLLISLIDCETWFDEVNGHDITDSRNGYAGSKGYAITGYYLCGGRKFRAHYLGDDKNNWTGEYWGCDEPIGIGRSIDAISISGGYGYQIRLKNGNWLPMVHGYDIFDSNDGYAGSLGKEIDAILIEGGNNYRVCYGGHSSNIDEVSKRVVKRWFGIEQTFSYTQEKTIIDNDSVKVDVKLIYKWQINYDGHIKFIIENNELNDINIGGKNLREFNEKLEQMMGNYKNKVNKLTISFKLEMDNGQVTLTFDILNQKIIIDAASKITKEHDTLRGAFRITIYLKNNNDNNKKAKEFAVAFSDNFLAYLKEAYDDYVSNVKKVKDLYQMSEKVPAALRGMFNILAAFSFIPILI